jgi:uncharacterized protein YuzE
MKVEYFQDTDTLLLTFSDREVAESRDLNENVLVELGRDGGIVAITIEHAREQVDVREFTWQLKVA